MSYIEKQLSSNVPDNMSINELYNRLIENSQKQTTDITKKIDDSVIQFADKLQEANQRIEILEKRLVGLERQLRRNNIAIFGLQINSPILQNTIHSLNNLLGITLTINDINFIRVPEAEVEKLPIIIEFVSFYKKQLIFQNVQKLKNTGISVVNDMCFEDRSEYKILKNHLKIARSQRLPAKIKGRTIEIDGNIYTPDDLRKLEDESGSNGNNKVDTGTSNVGGDEQASRRDKAGTVKGRNIVYSPPNENQRVLRKRTDQKR